MPAWYPIARVVASLLLMTIGGAGMYLAIVALKPIAADFDVSRGAASMTYTFTMIGFGSGGILMGLLSDRIGVMRPALVASVCMPLGFLLAGKATSIWQLYLVHGVLIGFLGCSATFAPLIADISHWFHRRRGLAVAFVVSGTYVAGALWPPVAQHFFDVVGWRETYRGIGWFCLLSMLPLSLLLMPRAPVGVATSAQPGAAHGDGPLGMRPATLQCLICAAGVGCCVAMAVPQVHIVAHATDLGYDAARGAEMLALMLGAGVVSRIASGWISDRIGGLRTLLLGSSLQALMIALFIPFTGLPALYALALMFGLSQGGIVPSYAIIIRTFFAPGEAGWRIATALLFTMLGMALGGWLAGALHDATGSYGIAFGVAVLFNLSNMAIAVLLLRRSLRLVPADASANVGA